MTVASPADLGGFLLARFAEDVETARAALGKWIQGIGPEALEMASRFSAHRILAEVESHRRILAAHPHEQRTEPHVGGRTYMCCESCGDAHQYVARGGWCLTLRALCMPFAEHPEYREDWRL